MVLAGTGGSLPGFEDHVMFAMPDAARIAAVPRSDAAGSHGVAEPSLDEIPLLRQVAGTEGSGRPADAGRPGKTGN